MKIPKGQPHPAVDKMLRELGGSLCEACSVPNWKIYHTPGNPCQKAQSPRHTFTRGQMRIELRHEKLPNGDIVPRGMVCIAEGERESILLDTLFGKKVGEDGLIAESTCQCRLSDGYGEHYVYIKAPPHGDGQ